MSAVQAGLRLLPMAIMMALGAVVSSRILARRGARLPMLAAGVGLAAGGVLLSRLTASSALLPLAAAFIVFGLGGGLVNAPITYTAVSGMPVSQAGVASGIASTSRQIGQCPGIAPGRYACCPAIFRRVPRSVPGLAAARRAVPRETASLSHLTHAGKSAAAAGPAAAAPAAGTGGTGRTARREATHRDRGQELHRVVVTLRAGARGRGLAHRAVQLERVATGAAAVLIAGHSSQSTRRRPGAGAPSRLATAGASAEETPEDPFGGTGGSVRGKRQETRSPGRAHRRRGRKGPVRSGHGHRTGYGGALSS